MHATTDGAGPLNAPWTIDTLLAADKGDGSGRGCSPDGAGHLPAAQVWGDVAAVEADATHARRFFMNHDGRGSVIGSPGTDFLHGGRPGVRLVAGEPGREAATRVRDSNVETLPIGGRLDVATPPQNGA